MAGPPLELALLGATGAVGRAIVEALEESDLEGARLWLLASERSAGEEVEFRGEPLRVEVVKEGAFAGCDLAFFAAGEAAARRWAPEARAAGARVVDLSPAFREDPGVPLVVAGLAPPHLAGPAIGRVGEPAADTVEPLSAPLVACPSPASAQLALALAPLRAAAGLERVAVVTLAAVSGAGKEAVAELEAELRAMLAFQEPPASTALPHRVAFNAVPQVGPFAEGGATDEERRTTSELRRLLGEPELPVSAAAAWIPVFHGHTQLVNVRTARPLSPDAAREALKAVPALKVLDAPGEGIYPMPMLAVNDDAVLVGRVRADPSQERGLDLVVVGDNLRRGAALNAIAVARQIASRLRLS
jgi:aspartate-semialdehyde dehydrogenase